MKIPEQYKAMVKFSKQYLGEHPDAETDEFLCFIPADPSYTDSLGAKGREAMWGFYGPSQRGYDMATIKIPIFPNTCPHCGTELPYEA